MRTQQPSYEDRDSEIDSPFAQETLFVDVASEQWELRGDELSSRSPFVTTLELEPYQAERDEIEEEFPVANEWSEEFDALADPGQDEELDAEAEASGPNALSSQDHAWVLALDHSALERLSDATRRRRYLEEVNWRDIEFPGNVPKGGRERQILDAHWSLSEELFSAMAGVTPERRVPSMIRYHDPAVVKVPGQPTQRLFPESRDAFVRMREAAKGDGVRLEISSSWRSAAKQAAISKAQPNPKAAARAKSAHMYGLAVDLRLSVPGLNVAEANTRTIEKMANVVRMYRSPVYKWMALRARHFGWYPYRREPWHWEYNPPGFKERFEGGTPSVVSPSSSTSVTSAPPTTSGPAAELVKFAQRVLNALAGEKLADDGDLGSRTRAALERFRKQHSLGSGGVLDMPTELALAQRALEELAQQSMFTQPGVRDAKTDQALAAFKAARGLGTGPTLDAPVRRALADALVRMPSRSHAAASASPAASVSSPTDHLGGLLWDFRPRSAPIQMAVFCTKAARGQQEVELLLYAHGLLDRCPGPASVRGIITQRPFQLAATADAATRPIVLAVPYLEWSKQGKFHPLGTPALLNKIVDEVLADLGRVQSSTAPALRDLVIAGHSRAYGLLEPLAAAHSSPEMQQGALARLSQVWAFDTTYVGDVDHWTRWLRAKPGLEVNIFYRPTSKTDKVGSDFYRQRGGRLKVIQANESHCEVPTTRLPTLLGRSAASASEELVFEEFLDEEFEPPEPLDQPEEFDPRDDREDEDELLFDEHEREDDLTSDEPADEQLALEDEIQEERDYEGPYSDEEEQVDVEWDAFDTEFARSEERALDAEAAFEFDDEAFADAQLEETVSNRSPLPVPPDRPVPFAPLPPTGAYWPVRGVRKNARVASYMYQAPSGVVGRSGGMFLAGRTGTRDGKQRLRWHVGIDVLANSRDVVVACEPGKIVGFGFFYPAKSGERTYRILIEHDHSGIVANYGEVTEDSLRQHALKVGMAVAAGQPIGFVSTTRMLHFETYIKGTTNTHRWWKDEPDPPRELLNPTRYLLFLRERGLPLSQSRTSAPAITSTPTTSGAPSTGEPQRELVRFAQRVLNASEGTKLVDDGDFGPLTRAAIVAFRGRYNLGAGDALDEATTLALAQRALEEMAQQSMVAQPGLLDARTREALSAFKSQRGLGTDAAIDAATREAIADALTRRRSSAITSGHSPRSGSTSPSSALSNLGAGLAPPTDPSAYRKFRLTTYYAADQREYPTGAVTVPIRDSQGKEIATCSPAFFASLSLEGSGKLTDGKVIKVAGRMVPVSHVDYAPVLAYHLKAYEKSNRRRAENRQSLAPTTNSGIVVKSGRIVEALAFEEVRDRGVGFGTEQKGIPAVPFRTLAADLGLKRRSAAAWKGKGGLVPVGTHVYIREYVGLQLPGGTVHDGWFIVNDTGGAIFGVHFDVFTGTRALRQKATLPEFGQVWFAGIEQRIKPSETYGLTK